MPETPESRRALWRAVIDQAVKDATTRSNAVADQVAKRQARAWLTHRSDDLNEVCALADLEPDAVRASAAAAIAAADIRLAAGKRRAPKADLAPQKPKRVLKRIELDGLNLTIGEWSLRTGLDPSTLSSRLAKGWLPDRILTQPISPGWAWKNTHKLKLGKGAPDA